MLLVGFFLNLFGLMRRNSLKYVLLNLFGGGLACTASILIEFFPFVILEGTWTVVALVGLGRLLRAPIPGGSGLSFEPRSFIDRVFPAGEYSYRA